MRRGLRDGRLVTAPSHWRTRPAQGGFDMAHLRMTAHYDAPIEKVFDLAVDYARYPEWNVSYEQVMEVEGPPAQVGTRFHGKMKLMGRTMEGWGEVTEVDRPRLLKVTGSGSGGGVTTLYRFTTVEDGTDAELEVDYQLPAGLFGKVADKLFIERTVERDLRHSLENFKAFVEEKPAPVE
jgi:uncharacterized protein YndB with AHSA1/START domain